MDSTLSESIRAPRNGEHKRKGTRGGTVMRFADVDEV
jgi:hypothetical protein